MELHPRCISGVKVSTKTSHAGPELVILGSIDERVDAAVGEHHHHAETIEPAGRVNHVAEKTQKTFDLVGQPACDEAAADRE